MESSHWQLACQESSDATTARELRSRERVLIELMQGAKGNRLTGEKVRQKMKLDGARITTADAAIVAREGALFRWP